MGAILLVGLVLAAGESMVSATSDWQLVGTHPDAAAQPTARGRTLHDLVGFQGKVYAGYGDYGENTGPIRHTPWGVVANQWQPEDWQDTEEVNNYQVVNGILFSPSIDPAWRGTLELASNASDYANVNGLDQWPDSDRMDSYHVFDIRQLGSAMIASGSSPGCNLSCATIWRSDNGGASFYVWYRSTRDASGVYGGDRCYHLATHGSRVWANCTSGKVAFNGSWAGDTAGYGHKESALFGSTLVTPGRGGNLYGFNGTERVLRGGSHKFVAVDGSHLYAVDLYNRIYRTADLASWAQVGTLPSSATSFTAMGGRLYHGDASSRLYAMGESSTATSTTTTSSTSTSTTSSTSSTTTTTTTAPTTTTTTAAPKTCFLGLICSS